jgi:hypothetical protein
LERLAEIRITKSILLIPERILWKYLPASEITAGIGRGKAYKRALACENRQNKIFEGSKENGF